RIVLFQSFAPYAIQPDVRLAMRFLMHADAPHAREDASPLFVPSTQRGEHIWTRLIQQLLAIRSGEDSWRLLDIAWAPLLSPQLQQQVNAWTFGASAAWTELTAAKTDPANLQFPADEWPAADICTLVQGLSFAVGLNRTQFVALLRRLPIHTIHG